MAWLYQVIYQTARVIQCQVSHQQILLKSRMLGTCLGGHEWYSKWCDLIKYGYWPQYLVMLCQVWHQLILLKLTMLGMGKTFSRHIYFSARANFKIILIVLVTLTYGLDLQTWPRWPWPMTSFSESVLDLLILIYDLDLRTWMMTFSDSGLDVGDLVLWPLNMTFDLSNLDIWTYFLIVRWKKHNIHVSP